MCELLHIAGDFFAEAGAQVGPALVPYSCRILPIGAARAATARLYGRLDVLVEPEQVRRIVFVLQRDKPLIAMAVSSPDPRGLFRVQVVDVHFAGRKGLHRIPELSGPPDVTCRLGRIGPRRDHVIIPLIVAQPEGGRVAIHPGRSAVEMENKTIDIGESIFADRSIRIWIKSSPSSFKKLDFQYR